MSRMLEIDSHPLLTPGENENRSPRESVQRGVSSKAERPPDQAARGHPRARRNTREHSLATSEVDGQEQKR